MSDAARSKLKAAYRVFGGRWTDGSVLTTTDLCSIPACVALYAARPSPCVMRCPERLTARTRIALDTSAWRATRCYTWTIVRQVLKNDTLTSLWSNLQSRHSYCETHWAQRVAGVTNVAMSCSKLGAGKDRRLLQGRLAGRTKTAHARLVNQRTPFRLQRMH
jgi:hypothetical protein